MEDILTNFGLGCPGYLRLYLDVVPDTVKARPCLIYIASHPTHFLPQPPQESMMVFLKHFNTLRQSLVGAGKIFAFPSNKVCDLTPLINERMQWAPGTPLKLYEVCICVVTQNIPQRPRRFYRKSDLDGLSR